MMTICINGLNANRGGGQTYIKNILTEFNQYNNDSQVILLVTQNNHKVFLKYASSKVTVCLVEFASKNVIFRTVWELLFLRHYIIKNRIDIYYAPGGIMLTRLPKHVRGITALRNMLPFDSNERKRFPFFSYERGKLLLLKYIFLLSYKNSDGVIFISKYSRQKVKEYLPKIEDKSVIIYHGLNKNFLNHPYITNESDTMNGLSNYYLYVSILDVYKAQKEVITSWIEMNSKGSDLPLVLVGPKYSDYGDEVIDLINKNPLSNIHYLGVVDYEKLPLLYKGAKALIFASSCECCPNILLEKLASGKPVICSNIQPMPEFGRDAVIYFNPYDNQSLKEAVSIVESENNYDKYSHLSYKRAQDFNWRKTTDETLLFLLKDQ